MHCVFPTATIWLIRVPVCLSFHSLSLCCYRNARRCPLYPFRPITVHLYWTNKYLQGGFVWLIAQLEWFKAVNIEHFMNGLMCRLVIYTVSFGLFCMGKFGTLCVVLSFPYEFLKWNWQGSTCCFQGLWFSFFFNRMVRVC